MVNKKRKDININLKISNKVLYTFIAVFILSIMGVGVFASTYTASGAGHPYTEISTCAEGETLQVVSGIWSCVSSTGGYLTGVERVTASGLAGGTTVYCPSGKKLMGGGCSCTNGGEISSSYPMDDHRWRCICSPTSGTISAVALCANAE
jgi:hypothetical protein